jgi:GT2 family glycosyltransferase
MPDDSGSASSLSRRGDLASHVAVIKPDIEGNFDEHTYIRAFPDVAQAIDRGELESGLQHYLLAGRAEGRLQAPQYLHRIIQDCDVVDAPMSVVAPRPAPASSIDAFAVSDSGAVFLVGWADDRFNRLVAISAGPARSGVRDWAQQCRVRRPDVETARQSATPYHYGFWVFAGPQDRSYWQHTTDIGAEWRIELRFANGAMTEVQRIPDVQGAAELRDSVMSYFAVSRYFGNPWMEASANLDRDAGDALTAFNRSISRSITQAATAERFGQQRKRFKGSIIVPLFGIADFLFLQACTYALGPGIEDYEFIYVVNSPELIDQLQREARIAEMAYGLAQTLVFQSDNAGFGPANNVAVQFARSDRLLCVNPDVFPQRRDWAQRHSDLIASLPAQQVRLFGSTLCYEDGTLMHGGMYFDVDVGVHTAQEAITRRSLIRVEHYGKGAPSWAAQYAQSRPVPAVTGAFISVERAWFEKLGGFTEDYVFGHYEDADLCLKSLQAGVPAWLHDLRMWHLEGKGSHRLPQHEGGSLLNRWLFSRKWETTIVPDLVGRAPRHALLQARSAEPAASARPSKWPPPPACAEPRKLPRSPANAGPGKASPPAAHAGLRKAAPPSARAKPPTPPAATPRRLADPRTRPHRS